MRGANQQESAFGVGLLAVAEGARREMRADVERVASQLGITPSQQQRWRSAGLLPAVVQRSDPRYGSEIEYPEAYCRQLLALVNLLREKRDLTYVGHQLWWRGFKVDEAHYREQLLQVGRQLDRILPLSRRFLARLSRRDMTAGDKLAERPVPAGTLATRVKGRLSSADLAAFMNVFTDVTIGDFQGYFMPIDGEDEPSLREIVERGFDIEGVDSRVVRGEAIKIQAEMPFTLAALSNASSIGAFEHTAKQPARTLEAARDDARLSLQMARDMQLALGWIYPGAPTGFRLAAWIGEKLSLKHVPLIVLYFAKLREADALTSSDAIAAMAQQAAQCRAMSLRLQKLREANAALEKVITPTRMRRVLADKSEAERFTRDLSLYIRPPIGLKRRACQRR